MTLYIILDVLICTVPLACLIKAYIANEEYKKNQRSFLAEEQYEFDKWQRGGM